MREKQHDIETRAAVQETLRLRAEEDAAALTRAREQMRVEIEAHKKRADTEIREAQANAQQQVCASLA